MIDVQRLIQSFEEIVGWPYLLGGRDRSGIDCSGAFVRAFRAQGGNIYHGSNRIVRAHCRGVFRITDAAQLEPGMPVFKVRQDGGEPTEYKPGGRYYDPAIVGNAYHIGLVCSVSPLRIIHVTTPVAKVDTSLGNWALGGYLIDGNYGASGNPVSPPEQAAGMAVVLADGGLRLRKTPDGEYVLTIPQGSVVPVLGETTEGGIPYVQTRHSNANGTFPGWVAAASTDGRAYLQLDSDFSPDEPGDAQGGEEDGAKVSVRLSRGTAEQALAALSEALGRESDAE